MSVPTGFKSIGWCVIDEKHTVSVVSSEAEARAKCAEAPHIARELFVRDDEATALARLRGPFWDQAFLTMAAAWRSGVPEDMVCSSGQRHNSDDLAALASQDADSLAIERARLKMGGKK